MPLVDPAHPLGRLLERDHRYTVDAYLFVLESLTFAQESLGMGRECRGDELEPLVEEASARRSSRRRRSEERKAERHVSGRDLCEAARRYGQQQYGFLAPTVLAAWGIRKTGDIGEIVFNMVETGHMRKTRTDKREDFEDVFDFDVAFAHDLPFAVPDAV